MDEVECDLSADFLRDVRQVFFVVGRHHDVADPRPERGDHFLADAADGRDFPAERDLAGHGEARFHGLVREERDDGSGERDARGRTVLRRGTVRYVDMEIVFLEYFLIDAERFCMPPDVAERRECAFLHDVAERTGELQFAAARHLDGLDLERCAAAAGPCHAGHDADARDVLAFVAGELARAEQFADQLVVHDDRFFRRQPAVLLHESADELAADRGDGAFQTADARLHGVVLDDLERGTVLEAHERVVEAIFHHLARDQVAFRDLLLFERGVAGQADDLHAVEQRTRDGLQHVRGRDEHDLAEVVVDLEVMVVERLVLLRVEHFEQRGRRISLVVAAELVQFVQHEHRIDRPCAFHALDDASGERADVGAAVAAYLRLVANAAERHADEFAVEGDGDGAAERGLADAGRSDEADDRGFAVLFELVDGEEFEDSFLHVLEAVVVGVQHGCRDLHVGAFFGRLRPRHAEQPVDVGVGDVVLRRGGRDHIEPFEFLRHDLVRGFGKVRLFDAFRDRDHVGIAVVLAKLLADLLELFPQEELALLLRHGVVDLALDLGPEAQDFKLAVEQDRQEMQAVLKLQRGEQDDLFREGDIERVGDHVRDARIVRHVEHGDLQFLREIRRERDDFLELLRRVADHRRRFQRRIRSVGKPVHLHDHVRLARHDRHEPAARDASHEHTDRAVREFQRLHDAGERADGCDTALVEQE